MLGTGISHSLPGLHGLSTPWRITLSDIYQSERSYSEKFHFVKLCGAPSVLYSPVDILFVVSALMQYLAKYPLCVDFKLKLTEFSYHCQTLLLWVYLTVSNMKLSLRLGVTFSFTFSFLKPVRNIFIFFFDQERVQKDLELVYSSAVALQFT
jgi:hypothetical protein